jgi:hypothetical protein
MSTTIDVRSQRKNFRVDYTKSSHDFRITWRMVFNSSGLSHGGPTHNKRKNLFMTTRISQWQRIAMLAAGIATSMVSMAWGQELYQTHPMDRSGSTRGHPAAGGSCPGWIELDNNPNMSMIAAGGGALFEMHIDGSIWWYIGPACSGGSCPGWVELDNNPLAIAIGVGGKHSFMRCTATVRSGSLTA